MMPELESLIQSDAGLADTIANRFGYKTAFALAVNKIFIAEKDPKTDATDDKDDKEQPKVEAKVADIELDSDATSHIEPKNDKPKEGSEQADNSEEKKSFNFSMLNDFDKVFEYLLRQGYFDRYYSDGDSDSDITLYSLTKAGISTLQKSTVQKELFGRTITLDHSGIIETAVDYVRHRLMAKTASELYKIDKIRNRVRGFKSIAGYSFCVIECADDEDMPECIIVPAIIAK